MDKIKLEDFLEYSYLSGIKVTEYGTIFIKANVKKDKTGYDRNYWIIKDGEKPKQLTFDGKAGFFTVKDNSIYFLAKRSEEEKRDILIGHEVIDRSEERLGGLEKAIEESPWFFL